MFLSLTNKQLNLAQADRLTISSSTITIRIDSIHSPIVSRFKVIIVPPAETIVDSWVGKQAIVI